MRESKYTPIHGTIKAMTARASLVITEGREVWIPNSVIFEDDLAGFCVGLIQEINVADWWHRKSF